jgi:hypothetical protein
MATHESPCNKIQPNQRSKLNLAIASAKRVRLPTFPCSLWFETKAKAEVFCVNHNCKFDEREWEGHIIGRGVHGFLNVLFLKIKRGNKLSKGRTPLMGLLTICAECSREGDCSDDADRLDQIIKETPGHLILGLSDKEVEVVLSSKAIIMEGILMDAIKTVGVDGRCKGWDMLRPLALC